MENSKKTEMLDIFRQIQDANPGFCFALTGSFALYLQGFELPREPGDLDIRVTMKSQRAEFRMPEQAEETTPDTENYPAELSERREFHFGEIKVDVFAIEKKKTEIKFAEGFPVVVPQGILQYKFDYAFDTHSPGPAQKHKTDLVFILERNVLVRRPVNTHVENLFD
jgi:hypothetical protein